MNNDNAIKEEAEKNEDFYFFQPLKRAKRLAKKHTITGYGKETVVVWLLILLFEVVLLCGNLVTYGSTSYNGRELISSLIHLSFNSWSEWGKIIVLYLAVIYLIILIRNIILKKGKYQKNIGVLWITNIILVLTVLFYIVSDYHDVLSATYLCAVISLVLSSMFMHGAVYEIQNGEELPLYESFIKRKIEVKKKMKNMTETEETRKKKVKRKKSIILISIVVLFMVLIAITDKIDKENLAKGTYNNMVNAFNANNMAGIWDISGINGNLVIYGATEYNPYFQCGIEGNMIQGQLINSEAQIFSVTRGEFTMIAKELIYDQSMQFRVDIFCTLPNGENRTYTDVIITKLDSSEIYQGICDGVINQAQADTGSQFVPLPLYVDYNGEMKTEIDSYGNMMDEILCSNNGKIVGGASLSCSNGGGLSLNGISVNYVVSPAMEFKSKNTYLE